MSQSSKQMILGALVPTAIAGASWRLPDAPDNSFTDFNHYRHIAQTLEQGRFHTLFFADGVDMDTDPQSLAKGLSTVGWEPLILSAALAGVTRHIGLISTASTTYSEPYNLARKFASLDHLSQGRAGWNLVTSAGGGENFNQSEHTQHDERYERAGEFYDVVTGLWDSWEDDAFVQDKTSGVRLDVSKLHVLNHKGKHFAVKGPLNIARPTQGYPVIAQAGASEAGMALASRVGELIFTAQHTIEQSLTFNHTLRQLAVEHGRLPQDLLILPGIYPVVGQTLEQAQAKYEQLQQLLDPKAFLSSISRFASLGYDLAELPFDAPVPLPPETFDTNTRKSRQKLIFDLIRRERPTVRQLFDKLTFGGHRIVIGTAQSIADDLQAWFEAGAADGFNILFSAHHAGVEDFVKQVIPELQKRGLFQREYAGNTLRENLGLAYRNNRHVQENSQ